MRQIGKVKQIQVQRASLKVGRSPARYYDPAPIQVVEKLLLTTEGVVGVTTEGEQILDIHNSSHPQTKNAGGVNGVSLGFSSHYGAMRRQFGSHLWDGCAGENILVETEEELTLDALGERVAFQDQESGAWLYLGQLQVAAPCVEFSHFALNEPLSASAEKIRETLIFLNEGLRGFYASFAGGEASALRSGAGVFAEI